MKLTLFATLTAIVALNCAARAQGTAPEPGTAPASEASPFPAAPTLFPVSQTVNGVTFTVKNVVQVFDKPLNNLSVYVYFGVQSDAPGAQPAPGHKLEDYVVSPYLYDDKNKLKESLVARVDGQRVLRFQMPQSRPTHLKMRVSFQDPNVKAAGKNSNELNQVTFEKVPIPQDLKQPISLDSQYKAPQGALVTLKTVTSVPHHVTDQSDKRTADDRDIKVILALKQPAHLEGFQRKATLQYIDSDWNPVFFARDDKGVEWARGDTSFGSPMDLYSDGEFSYTFPFRDSPGARTFDIEFGLREVVKTTLPASAFRRFFFDLDLQGVPIQVINDDK